MVLFSLKYVSQMELDFKDSKQTKHWTVKCIKVEYFMGLHIVYGRKEWHSH